MRPIILSLPILLWPGAAMAQDPWLWANRVTWGIGGTAPSGAAATGSAKWADEQLILPADSPLPQPAQQLINAMTISKRSMPDLVREISAERRSFKRITDPNQKKQARAAYRLQLRSYESEAASRQILRDIYSPAQFREQMTWFWMNHFNILASKADIGAMIGDFEDSVIRPRAFGKFRDLLEATLRHPAMLRYLDNYQNAKGHINENYARELLELHSMGVGSGYTQKDVQELARILTGVGIVGDGGPARVKPADQHQYFSDGLLEFNPARHDFGDKQFLGHTIRGSGYGEVRQALDIIASSPATARFISTKIAKAFVGDNPPPTLTDRMAYTFTTSQGDIAAVLRTMLTAPEFEASLGKLFKDPMHYVISAVRAAYGNQVIDNPAAVTGWLKQMGEPLYERTTPDGYPLDAASWSGPGQMITRFGIAQQIGSGRNGLSGEDGKRASPFLPSVQRRLTDMGAFPGIGPATATALQGKSPADQSAIVLSSPEFMRR